MIDVAKASHHKSQIADHASDPKALFRVVKGIMGQAKKQVLPEHESLPSLLKQFNDYFVDKIRTIRTNLDVEVAGAETVADSPTDCRA